MFCQANTNPDLHLAKIEHMPQMIVFVTNSFLTKAREGANIECKKKIPPPQKNLHYICITFLILTNLKVVILDMTIIGF